MRWQFLDALRHLHSKQSVIEDSHGNLSCRDADGFIIKPSGMEFDQIFHDDIVFVAADGETFGKRKPSIDTDQHKKIYDRNRWVKAICHTHSPYATAFAIMYEHIDVGCTEHADYFGRMIRVNPYQGFEWGELLLDDDEYGVLLGGHGALICSPDGPMHAAKLAVALEMIAKKYFIVRSMGQRVGRLPNDQVVKWHTRYRTRYGQ